MNETSHKNRILIIDDDVSIGELLKAFLSRKGYEVTIMHSGNHGIEACKKNDFDIVFCDYRLGDKTGFEVLTAIKNLKPDTKVIIITAYSDVKIAVAAIKLGAIDFIVKPLVPDEILAILNSGDRNKIERDNQPYVTNEGGVPGFWKSESPNMKELYNEMELIAPTDYSVIIYGESGTGKEMMARAIHLKSKRKDYPFVALDCGTLSTELAGSELFGHVKGSFTGAHTDKVGHFEMANKGTLFLDEIGNLPLDVQASLLRVVQERKYRRIGDNKEQNIDVRIIVASNENLQTAYHRGNFREDLYHRFNEFKMNLPPLRERKEDIMLLADFFLHSVNNELGKDVTGFDEDVKEIFFNYDWPGNLRELKNIVRRSALLTKGGIISRHVLPHELMNLQQEMVTGNINVPVIEHEKNLKKVIANTEKEIILNTLMMVKNNKTKAASILNIDRKTLYNKLKEFGIIPAKDIGENTTYEKLN